MIHDDNKNTDDDHACRTRNSTLRACAGAVSALIGPWEFDTYSQIIA